MKFTRSTSAVEAARALMERWPVDTGEAYEAALRTCLAAMEGREAPDAAREAFLKAADEADVFIDWIPSPMTIDQILVIYG